jgi:hypothetical protein
MLSTTRPSFYDEGFTAETGLERDEEKEKGGALGPAL